MEKSNYKSEKLIFEGKFLLYSAYLPLSVSAQTSGDICTRSDTVFCPKKVAMGKENDFFEGIN